MTGIETDRLRLRQWHDHDRPAFAAINADRAVMQYFPAVLTREQSDEFVDRMQVHLERFGWGLWAVEVRSNAEFVGFVGLWPAGFDPLRSERQVEIGWRLKRSAWGRGFTTEAARAVLVHAFEVLNLSQVVSFTAVANQRSQAVMVRLGMVRDPSADFDHPRLPDGHPLRPHVVYRLAR